MDYISIICIAIGLAMDAFAVSVSNGATTRNLKLPYAIKLSLFFGGFQLLMPVIGWLVGKAGEGFISNVDHWVAFILLSFIGGKMIADYIKEKKEEVSTEKKEEISTEKKDRLSNKTILVLAIATSIDALATGVILPSAVGASTFELMLVSVIIIGVLTFIICVLGVYLGKLFGVLLSRYSTIFGGTVLILIGGKILFEHLVLK
ncbi:MAG: manganese efflux pump MntP family protein [Acutalibacteraceae bacterium]|nr:manganese efflux pump MntP family protein [Acutalibacteraceae bacterium]